jgi:hypothetical protein
MTIIPHSLTSCGSGLVQGMPLIREPAKSLGNCTPACFHGSAHDTTLDVESLLTHDVYNVDAGLL